MSTNTLPFWARFHRESTDTFLTVRIHTPAEITSFTQDGWTVVHTTQFNPDEEG